MAASVIGRFSPPKRRWNSSGIGWVPDPFVVVVGGDERDGAVVSRTRQTIAMSTSASSGLMTRSRSVSVLEGAMCSSGIELAGGGQGVLDEAVVAEFGQFLDADAGVREAPPPRPRSKTRGVPRGSGLAAAPVCGSSAQILAGVARAVTRRGAASGRRR